MTACRFSRAARTGNGSALAKTAAAGCVGCKRLLGGRPRRSPPKNNRQGYDARGGRDNEHAQRTREYANEAGVDETQEEGSLNRRRDMAIREVREESADHADCDRKNAERGGAHEMTNAGPECKHYKEQEHGTNKKADVVNSTCLGRKLETLGRHGNSSFRSA